MVGCLAIVGGLALCGVVAAGLGVWYTVATPRQVPVASVVGPETVAAFRIRGSPSDPGITALMARAADAMVALQARQNLPPSLRWFQTLQALQLRLSMGYVTPREVGVLLESDPAGGEPRAVTVVALRHLPRLHQRMMGFMLRQGPRATVTRRGGIDIIEIAPGAHLAITRGTVFLGGSADAMGAVLDRLANPPAVSAVGTRLAELGDAVDGEAVVLLGRTTVVPDAAGCETLSATLDVVDADMIEVQYDVACGDGGTESARALVGAVESAIASGLPGAMAMRVTPTPGAAGARGVARITGLGTWIQGGFSTGAPGAAPAGASPPSPAGPEEDGDAPAPE